MDVKPYLPIEDQLQLLKSRGLCIDDEDEAIDTLHQLNYYRLSGYMLTLKKGDRFYKDVHFSDIMQIYHFDKELKGAMLFWLEDIEVALRTHIAYILGKRGSTSYLNVSNFASDAHHSDFLKELKSALSDNKNEAFIKHHNTKYGGTLPVWVVVETLSFGAVSRLFTALDNDIKEEICEQYYYGIPPKYIENWLECLVVVRNLCAHHARLFNRGLPNAIKFSRQEFSYIVDRGGYDSNAVGKKLFFPVIILDRLSPSSSVRFRNTFQTLREKYPFVDVKHYGFLNNWEFILNDINKNYFPG